MRGSKAILKRADRREAGPFGQIVKFEPRRPARQSFAAGTPQPVEDDLDDFARFEQEQDEPIDYRHRMIMNLIALAILISLVGLGVWIAHTISDLQREQDCRCKGAAIVRQSKYPYRWSNDCRSAAAQRINAGPARRGSAASQSRALAAYRFVPAEQ